MFHPSWLDVHILSCPQAFLHTVCVNTYCIRTSNMSAKKVYLYFQDGLLSDQIQPPPALPHRPPLPRGFPRACPIAIASVLRSIICVIDLPSQIPDVPPFLDKSLF